MANPPPDAGGLFSTPLPEELRKSASEMADPQARASLRESAARLERAEARLNAAASSGHEALDRFRAEVEARRRSKALPAWAVAIVLLAFAAFLVLVGLKHYS